MDNAVFTPVDVLDYVYGWLHSVDYREQYKEFLKVDFPRVPYPDNKEMFLSMVSVGRKLRRLHLLEGVAPVKGLATFPVEGSDEIETARYVEGNVFINENQYFKGVPKEVWEFYIGGYQPAQKWLKDRKGCVLGYNEKQHYQRIIAALKGTVEVMREMDFLN